jgi:glutamate carboxypeptidase
MIGARMRVASVLATLAWLTAPTANAALTAEEQRIVAAADAGLPSAIELLAETVGVPSATENLDGVRKAGAIYLRELDALDFDARWLELPSEMQRAGHLLAERRGSRGKRVLLIGHVDTVLQSEPYRRAGSKAFGSGVSDMKGGNLVIVAALRALHTAHALDGATITVMMTGDEEDPGTPNSVTRKPLVEAAARSDAALAFEGATPDLGVIGRRGVGTWHLAVTGNQAHSSGIFREKTGYGAIFEAARILDQFRVQLPERNLTYNPSIIVGGTEVTYDAAAKGGTAQGKTNVVPRRVEVEGDLRYLSRTQFESAAEKMRRIATTDHLPGTDATFTVQFEYPAMAPTKANEELLGMLDRVSRDLGATAVHAQDPATRGAGDISFVCEGRIACLDGLGAVGELEHAPGEAIDLDALPLQIKRAALLIYRLTR